MPDLKALIFDVDGTLAETERDGHRVAFNKTFEQMGFNWHWDEQFYGQLLEVSGGKERMKYFLQDYQPDFSVPDDLNSFIEQLHAQKIEYYQKLLRQGEISLRPGVKRLIQEAREAGIKLAIATTSALPNVLALVEKTLDPSWFEVIAAGDMVPQKKPAPDIYYYALEHLQFNPENCLVFEDSDQGLTAAKAVGLKTVVTVNDYTINQDLKQADLVINHLGEPDENFKVLQGNCEGYSYFNLELAQLILEGKP